MADINNKTELIAYLQSKNAKQELIDWINSKTDEHILRMLSHYKPSASYARIDKEFGPF